MPAICLANNTLSLKTPALYIIMFIMCFKPVFPVLEYMVNYDYIARELCENKNKPELNCNGQCYLMKSLAEEAEKQLPGEQRAKPGFEIQLVFFSDPGTYQIGQSIIASGKQEIRELPNTYSYLFKIQLLRPPIC